CSPGGKTPTPTKAPLPRRTPKRPERTPPMDGAPAISLIVPTRRRTPQLRRFLDSLAATASRPHDLEVILVLDEDDEETRAFRYDGLPVRRAVVAPGLTMGAWNMAGYEASPGRYLML